MARVRVACIMVVGEGQDDAADRARTQFLRQNYESKMLIEACAGGGLVNALNEAHEQAIDEGYNWIIPWTVTAWRDDSFIQTRVDIAATGLADKVGCRAFYSLDVDTKNLHLVNPHEQFGAWLCYPSMMYHVRCWDRKAYPDARNYSEEWQMQTNFMRSHDLGTLGDVIELREGTPRQKLDLKEWPVSDIDPSWLMGEDFNELYEVEIEIA